MLTPQRRHPYGQKSLKWFDLLMRWRIGSGGRVRFWQDNWLGTIILLFFFLDYLSCLHKKWIH